jgi:hypothetical protein
MNDLKIEIKCLGQIRYRFCCEVGDDILETLDLIDDIISKIDESVPRMIEEFYDLDSHKIYDSNKITE